MSATNRGSTRCKQDYYPTPLSAFRPLIPYLDKGLFHWEPACGDRRLIEEMILNKIKCDGKDLNTGYNFLEDWTRRDCIITNPPYSLAKEFIEWGRLHSLEMFFLLRLNFLGSQERHFWWKRHTPDALFILSCRPSFVKRSTDACEYAWYYWGARHSGIRFLWG